MKKIFIIYGSISVWVSLLLILLAIKFLSPHIFITESISDTPIGREAPQVQQVTESFGPTLPPQQDKDISLIESYGPKLPLPQDQNSQEIESFGPMLPQ